MPCVFVRISRILLTDQFIACGKSRDVAHDLASLIWIAVLDNLEENERTFALLKRLSQEGDVSATHTTILYQLISYSAISPSFLASLILLDACPS